MKPNILFLYGQDSYTSRQKLNAIKQKYVDASLGDTNLAVIDGEKTTIDEIVRQLYALPFLAKSRLVVINNLLTSGKADAQEKALDILNDIPQTTVALFYEQGAPDRRGKLFKKLSLAAQVQEFPALDLAKLKRWITNYVQTLNATIDPAGLDLLIQAIGPDLWRLTNELSKLALLSANITREIIEQNVELPIETNIFGFLDGIANRKPSQALQELDKLLKSGEPPIKLLAIVQRSMRTIAVLAKQGNVPSDWKIHPFVLQKSRAQARQFSQNDITALYKLIATIDYQVKTGTIEGETGLVILAAKTA